MFPHPCGDELADAVKHGADPKTVVPDEYVVAHGGTGPIPPLGEKFSGTVGPGVVAAGSALPFGRIRVTTAGAIRAKGGIVEWEPEISRFNTINRQHVNIVEVGSTSFSEIQINPVPAKDRIDADKKKRSGGGTGVSKP